MFFPRYNFGILFFERDQKSCHLLQLSAGAPSSRVGPEASRAAWASHGEGHLLPPSIWLSRTRRRGARASELFGSKLPLLLTQLILSVYAASLLIVLVSYWNWMQILLACFRTKFIRFHPMQHLGGKQCIHIGICKSCPFQPPWPLTKSFSCPGLLSFLCKILYRLSLCSGPNIIMSRRSHPYPCICLLVS